MQVPISTFLKNCYCRWCRGDVRSGFTQKFSVTQTCLLYKKFVTNDRRWGFIFYNFFLRVCYAIFYGRQVFVMLSFCLKPQSYQSHRQRKLRHLSTLNSSCEISVLLEVFGWKFMRSQSSELIPKFRNLFSNMSLTS